MIEGAAEGLLVGSGARASCRSGSICWRVKTKTGAELIVGPIEGWMEGLVDMDGLLDGTELGANDGGSLGTEVGTPVAVGLVLG